MTFLFNMVVFLLCTISVGAQSKLDRTLKKLNKESIPYIQVDALKNMNPPLLLDARKKEEYMVSHIKNAIWVGYKNFDLDSITSKIEDKNEQIIVYCSIGVRSENIGEKLMNSGYLNVKNLYGGIFEWKNKGYPVYDIHEKETEKVHAFSKHWGKFLKKGEKVYDPVKVDNNK